MPVRKRNPLPPRLREATRPKPVEPVFIITEEPKRSNPVASIMFLLVVVALLAGVGYAAWANLQRPDEHYVRAKRLVDDYERGKAIEERNYNNPIYDEALADLEKVRPGSRSAEPAAALAESIRTHREDFLVRLEQQGDGVGSARERREDRDGDFMFMRRQSRMLKVTEYPECEDEEGARPKPRRPPAVRGSSYRGRR